MLILFAGFRHTFGKLISYNHEMKCSCHFISG